jgi:hypothetical protein
MGLQVLLLLVVLALGPLGLAQRPLKTVAWGGYTLRIEGKPEGGQVARILAGERTQLEIQGWLLNASFGEVTGKAPKELLITDFSGGAHCCLTVYLFTQEGGVRNLLYEELGDESLELRDLDGDGRFELVLARIYSYFGDLPFALSPGVVRVYAYDGSVFYEVTRNLPSLTLREVARYRKAFLEGKRRGDLEAMKGNALGYWVNALVVGRGVAAKSWLMQHAPFEVRRWLLVNEEALLRSVSALGLSYNRTLPPNTP